jgi:hypothetical protein
MPERKRRHSEPARTPALGGREAELLRGNASRQQDSASRGTRDAIELHVCESCHSNLVFPTDWAPAGSRHWAVQLRCPDCEWEGEGVYSQDIVDRFDEVLDDGTEAILDDLMRLTHANMEDEIDRFVAALNADQVLPEDF